LKGVKEMYPSLDYFILDYFILETAEYNLVKTIATIIYKYMTANI
jgi:hypothetical protein